MYVFFMHDSSFQKYFEMKKKNENLANGLEMHGRKQLWPLCSSLEQHQAGHLTVTNITAMWGFEP